MARGPSEGGNHGAQGTRRRRLPAVERRALILDAAVKTFAARGYSEASMEDIAGAAGVSKAVVYDHVASKHELYTALLESVRKSIESAVEEALADAGAGEEERIRSGVAAFFRYVEQHPEECRLLFLELQGAQVSKIGRELEQRISGSLAAMLGTDPRVFDGHPDRERQLKILGELLKSSLQGLASWWHWNPEFPCEDLVERSVAVIIPAIERARGRAYA